jgi:hypothetical protein
MLGTCECEVPDGGRAELCQECGTTCCPSCALAVGLRTYCRWCATSLVGTT